MASDPASGAPGRRMTYDRAMREPRSVVAPTRGRVFRRSAVDDAAGRGVGVRVDHPRLGRAGVPRCGRRGDRRQRRPWARGDRRGHGRPGRPSGLRARQHVHDRAARGLRHRGRRGAAGRRSGDLPGLGRLRGDRDGPQARPRLSPRPRRARPRRRHRPARQLPRQHARGAGPVGPAPAAPAVRAVAGPVPARLGGLPVPRRRGRGPRPGRCGRARRRARARPSPRPGPGRVAAFVAEPIVGATLAAVGAAGRLLAGHRGGLLAPRRAARSPTRS